MQYEIFPNPRRADQVGLRLKCNQEIQAEAIQRLLRQEGFQVSRLMQSYNSSYTHFVYVTATETNLGNIMPKIKASLETGPSVDNVKVAVKPIEENSTNRPNFKSWQKQFIQVVKQLNSDSPRPTSSVQEIDPTRLQQQIAAGKITEIEERLLQQANINDSNALRTLIALYHRTNKIEEIVELGKAKRSEILALPTSGRLVEQLVTAHLQHYQQTNNQESLRAATLIAQEFLPELERLRQANSVRKLLHQTLTPQEPLPTVEGAPLPLSERLTQLLEIEPAERIYQLEPLKQKYPKATNVILALAESYAVTDNTEKAIELYQSVPIETEEVKIHYGKLLLNSDRPQEVIDLIPDSEDISPALAGLRGAALYRIGQESQALYFLEKAWQANNRSIEILLTLARLWASRQNLEQAAIAYQDLLETSADTLTVEDYVHIAEIADGGGFGDISDEQVANYYERCLNCGWNNLHRLPTSKQAELLKRRFSLRTQLNDIDKLINAYADWLEWLANENRFEELGEVLAKLRVQVQERKINLGQQFELLEIIEPFISTLPQLRSLLINDYQSIAFAEIEEAVRYERSEEAFLKGLIRALWFLDSCLVQEVNEYRQQCYAQTALLGVQPLLEDDTTTETINLSSLRLALVGGHEATRREVIRELKESYSLGNTVEVAPSSEAYVDRSTVQNKINNCDLIAVITGYMGHDLSKIVSELKKDGVLIGEVLPLSCRGKSGVVREILSWWIGR
jgi:thioredoxin-like negative regulator of GroEL